MIIFNMNLLNLLYQRKATHSIDVNYVPPKDRFPTESAVLAFMKGKF